MLRRKKKNKQKRKGPPGMPKVQLHSGLLLRPLRNFGIDRAPKTETEQDTPELTPPGTKEIERRQLENIAHVMVS